MTSRPEPRTRVHRLVIAYDGTPFFGWQRQDPQPTVQLSLEQAVKACWGGSHSIHGSGRTDRGVHALGQVATFEAPAKFREMDRLRSALNAHLPDEIRIMRASLAPEGFHARFSATGKEYLYRILNAPVMPPHELNRAWHIHRDLNLEHMREAMACLIGTHDFASFASNPGYARETTVRTITHAGLSKKPGGILEFRFRGDGFLYRMVRNLAGALAKVGHGRVTPAQFREILTEKRRSAAPPTAPPEGLYLARVFYASGKQK